MILKVAQLLIHALLVQVEKGEGYPRGWIHTGEFSVKPELWNVSYQDWRVLRANQATSWCNAAVNISVWQSTCFCVVAGDIKAIL